MTDSYVIPREHVFGVLWLHAARALVAAFALLVLPGISAHAAESSTDVEARISRLAGEVQAAEDVRAIKRLQRAYGYYVDKGMWEDLAALFTDDAVANYPAGIFVGKDTKSALPAAGPSTTVPPDRQPTENYNIYPKAFIPPYHYRNPVTGEPPHYPSTQRGGPDARHAAAALMPARGTSRLPPVKDRDHAYNTFGAGYQGGWAKSASRGMPGPSSDVPPDGPPTATFAMFPAVYDIPFHYPNPVTGRTEVVPVSASKDPQTLAALSAQDHGMPAAIAAALREIGPKIDGARTGALYAPLQPTEPYSGVTVTRDLHYGPHERHVLDVFTAEGASSGERPVVVFIHGGGFSRGAKHTPGSPFYDNVGVWAAHHGLVGITINYRLAPQFQWPSGIEDLTLLINWLKSHVSTYGGDPGRIFLWGHSAGAAHVGDYLAHAVNSGTDPGIAGAILTSGFYILGDQVSIWKDYYGADVSQYAARSSLPGLLKTTTPLLVTYAELDPESFQSDSRALIEARAREGKPVRSVRLVGASHISETYAVGTSDESLSGPVLDFIHDAGGKSASLVKGGS